MTACQSSSVIVISQNFMTPPSFNYTVGVGGLVNFESTVIGINPGTIINWNFGDLSTGTGSATSHVYSNGGIHIVSYTISSGAGCSASLPVNVTGIPCSAISAFNLIYSGTPQLWLASPVYFGNITGAIWNWGDGNTSNTLFTSHTYSAPGNYNICLSVTVSCANSSSTCSSYNIYKTVNTNELMLTVNVVKQIVIGLQKMDPENNNFILFPNPTNSTFYIKNTSQKNGLGSAEIKIFNLEGREIENLILENGTSTSSTNNVSALRQAQGPSGVENEIKIENLKAGIYFVEIKIENAVYRKKVVVIR